MVEQSIESMDLEKDHFMDGIKESKIDEKMAKVDEIRPKGIDFANKYENLIYSIFDLCYSMITGENQLKTRE